MVGQGGRRAVGCLAIVALALASMTACRIPSESAPQQPASKPGGFPAPGVQPLESLKPGVEDRIAPALLPANLQVLGFSAVSGEVVYTDPPASDVCGMGTAPGVYDSMFGQRRTWKADGLTLNQFAGAFGEPTAAEAIAQVEQRLNCGSYRDRDGDHSGVVQVPLRTFPKIDGRLMFCETLNGTHHICNVLFARQDVLTRLTVRTAAADSARSVAQALAPRAAAVMAKAW